MSLGSFVSICFISFILKATRAHLSLLRISAKCSFNKMSYFWNSISRRFIHISKMQDACRINAMALKHTSSKTHLTDIGMVLKNNNVATLRDFSLFYRRLQPLACLVLFNSIDFLFYFARFAHIVLVCVLYVLCVYFFFYSCNNVVNSIKTI